MPACRYCGSSSSANWARPDHLAPDRDRERRHSLSPSTQLGEGCLVEVRPPPRETGLSSDPRQRLDVRLRQRPNTTRSPCSSTHWSYHGVPLRSGCEEAPGRPPRRAWPRRDAEPGAGARDRGPRPGLRQAGHPGRRVGPARGRTATAVRLARRREARPRAGPARRRPGRARTASTSAHRRAASPTACSSTAPRG